MNKAVLVTGGAGYIGSHTCHQLIEAGHKVVVVDNFYSGHRWAVPDEAILVEGDAGDIDLTTRLMHEQNVDTVIHFAGHIVVMSASWCFHRLRPSMVSPTSSLQPRIRPPHRSMPMGAPS
jgi:nucleoside-diphosphate-sugar epimerase